MTEIMWRETQPSELEQSEDGPWRASDAVTQDSTASRLLLAATRCLIVAQLDPRGVEDDVTAMLGASHRRVTILLRTLLCEMALHARRRISIGSPCHPRLTADEARLLDVIAAAGGNDVATAHGQAATLLGGGATDRVVPLAAALGEAMRDAGLPMRRAGSGQSPRTLH